VLRLFEEAALDRHEEGIIIKQPDSYYLPSDRSARHWVKLKTDYIDELGDSLDLVILGGYYGKRQTEESINVFLVGVIKSIGDKTAMPLCKVGTGLSIQELSHLQLQLKPHWKRYDPRFPPKTLGAWKPF
jgi:ATP-dependent DNA ligase